jgi:hypothetical protein
MQFFSDELWSKQYVVGKIHCYGCAVFSWIKWMVDMNQRNVPFQQSSTDPTRNCIHRIIISPPKRAAVNTTGTSPLRTSTSSHRRHKLFIHCTRPFVCVVCFLCLSIALCNGKLLCHPFWIELASQLCSLFPVVTSRWWNDTVFPIGSFASHCHLQVDLDSDF